MLEAFKSYLDNRGPSELARDFVDIVVVYYVFYRLLLVARGTRAMQVAAGLGIVALLYVIAQAVGLVTIVTLVGSLLQSIILVIVVVFQNDIRRALQRVGSRAFFGNLGRAHETEVIDQVVQAAGELARHRIGAIITFEQDANLDEFIGQNKGIELDSKVSAELLVSLFIPEGSNKLHDGAVVIRNLRIAKAGVFYPMPENRSFDPTFGSRHRAAIGITEETDAVVVVVSEERGSISFCFNGNIASNLEVDQLREMLTSIMNPKVRKKSRQLHKRRGPISRIESRKDKDQEEEAPPSSLRKTPGSTPPPPLRKSSTGTAPAEGDERLGASARGADRASFLPADRKSKDRPTPLRATSEPRTLPSDDREREGNGSSSKGGSSGKSRNASKTGENGSARKRGRAGEDGGASEPGPSTPAPASARSGTPSPPPPESDGDRPTQASADDSDDDSLRLKIKGKARPMPRAKERDLSADPEDPESSSKPL